MGRRRGRGSELGSGSGSERGRERGQREDFRRERERAWICERLCEWLGFRIFAFYIGVLGRRFLKNRRPVFWKSSAKIILGDDFLKSSPKIPYLGDDVLHYKSRRPRWRKSSAKSSIIKFRISWFWWSEKRNWKPTVRYDQHNELRGWKKFSSIGQR